MDILAALNDSSAHGQQGSRAAAAARESQPNAPAELLDYGAVDQVEDTEELQWILGTLRRGVHGRYPELEQHVEARLLALSPPQVQAQVARLRAPAPTPDEVLEMERGLAAWEAEAQARDRGWLDKAQKTTGAEAKGRILPPVRNSASSTSTGGSYVSSSPPAQPPSHQEQQQQQQQEEKAAPAAPEATEAEEQKKEGAPFLSSPLSPSDTDSESSSSSSSSSSTPPSSKPNPNNKPPISPLRPRVRSAEDAMLAAVLALSKKAEELGISADLSLGDKKEAARAAKEEGNARFKTHDYAGAIERFTASLAYDSSSVEHAAVAYANRALAHLKLGRFLEAEADASLALERDHSYPKALLRRGQARLRQGKWDGARGDLESVVQVAGEGSKERREARTLLAALTTAAASAAAAGKEEKEEGTTAAPAPVAVAGGEGETQASSAPSRPSPTSSGSSSGSLSDPALLVGPRPGYRRVKIVEEEEEEEKGGGGNTGAGAAAAAAAAPPLEEEKERGSAPVPPAPAPAAASSSSARAPAAAEKTDGDKKEEEVEALKRAGNALLTQGGATGAIDAYTRALALATPASPVAAALLNNRSLAHLRKGDWKAAMADASACLGADPGNVKALYRRGKAACALAKALLVGGGEEEREEAAALVQGGMADLEVALSVEPGSADIRREYKAARALSTQLVGGQASSANGKRGKEEEVVEEGKEPLVLISKPPKEEGKQPTQPPAKPRTSSAIAATAATAASLSSPPLLQEVTTRPRLPQTSERASSSTPASPTQPPIAAKPTTAPPAAAAAANGKPPSSVPLVPAPTAIPVREPAAPPKTLHQLEQEWRSLRHHPQALARYLRKFPLATFPRVFKPATDPDVVAGVFRVVAEELCDDGEPAVVLRVLEGMTRAEGFGMLRVMMSKDDQAHVKRALDFLETAATSSGGVKPEAVAALRAKYEL